MSKIHITLVGGQTTPVYQGIVYANPDKIVLIHSQQSEREANRIYTEVKVTCELLMFDPVDLQVINEAILKLKSNLKATDEISINMSSGTKMWSLLFYNAFVKESFVTLYVIDQNNKLWNLKTFENADVHFDMDVQFRLLGNPLKKYRSIDDYTDKDKKLIKVIREIRQFNFQDFNETTDYLSRYKNQSTAVAHFGAGSEITWIKDENTFNVVMKKKNGSMISKTLMSEHVRDLLLNSGWFEYEIALLLFKWDKAKQLRMNCVFPTQSGSPKNEIDIIINTGNKLLFVECKTQIKKETDVDKFASAVKVYGGLGSKALFVTDAPMNNKAREKCADHGIMTFSLQDNLFNLEADNLLFEMLDNELLKLNAK